VRTAVISDIHGNLEALKVVLADIDERSVDRIVCLGDVLGYGPDPVACADLVAERCEWCLMGNHDFGVLYEPTNFNLAAEQACYWTRRQFDAEPDEESKTRRLTFLNQLRVRVEFDDFVCVHASPRRPINEYVFPEDALNSPNKMKQIFDWIPKYCLCGHTHVPGVFTDEPEFYPPDEIGDDDRYNFIEGEKAIINVGSVGQPRDLDPRAAYAVMDETGVSFHRVEYNIEETAARIRAVPELNNWLADRLFEGR